MTEDDPLLQLLRAERAVRPTLASVEHGWQRLASDLAAHAAPLPIASGPLKLSSWWLVPKWILTGFAVGLVGAGTLAVGSTLAAKQKPVQLVAPARSSQRTTGAAQARPSAIPSASAAAPAAEAHPAEPTSRAMPQGSSSAAAPTSFDAEFKLIARAKAALDARQLSEAKRLLAEHAQQFPHGVFATEREALEVQALCAERPQNSALVERFAALHPASPLLPRLRRACDRSSLHSTNESNEPREPMAQPSTGE